MRIIVSAYIYVANTSIDTKLYTSLEIDLILEFLKAERPKGPLEAVIDTLRERDCLFCLAQDLSPDLRMNILFYFQSFCLD